MNPNYENSIPYDLIWLSASGNLTEDERIHLEEWKNRDAQNQGILQEILEIQALNTHLDIYQTLNPEKSWQNLERKISSEPINLYRPKAFPSKIKFTFLSIAASFLMIGLFLGLYFRFTELKTKKGEILNQSFADGTSIHLQENTSIRYKTPIWGPPRKLELTYGKAYFSVKHDASHPFQILLGKALVEDLGTEFQISKETKGIKIDVFTGKIAFIPNMATKQFNIVGQGESIFYDLKSENLVSGKNSYSTLKKAPKVFQFLNLDLGSAAKEMEKSYNICIQFDNPSLSARKITGSYAHSNPDSLLNAIGITLNLKISKSGNRYTLSNR